MEQKIKRFNINGALIKDYYKKSLILKKNGKILIDSSHKRGIFITNRLDCGQKGMKWGRIVINGILSKSSEYCVYAMASDNLDFIYNDQLISYDEFFNGDEPDIDEKLKVISSSENSKYVKNLKDILLNGVEGRYLWLAFEIKYASSASDLILDNIMVYFPYDSLIKYFPEIYRKNKNSFFERYLSIFSTLNKGYQMEIENASNLLDLNKTSNEALLLLSKWLGMNVNGNFLNSDQLRILLKNARYLNQYKGTTSVISKIVKLFIGIEPIIIEQMKVKQYATAENIRLYQDLYGADPYKFLIILNRELDEELFYQLKALINIFKPARTKAMIIFLNQQCKADSYCYIDINARISGNIESLLDNSRYLDDNVMLAQ